MSYPRKRALLACDFCRQRKRRCDGKKPVCGNCADAEADCCYQELPTQRLEPPAVPGSMSRRLESIETLLTSHSEALEALSRSDSGEVGSQPIEMPVLPPRAVQGSPEDSALPNGLHGTSPAGSATAVPGTSPNVTDASNVDLPPFTIPPKHVTSTNSLLALPMVTSLVGEFPDDLFFRIESQRQPPGGYVPSASSMPYLDRDVTDLLVATFFSIVHPCHPILDREEFFVAYENVLTKGLDFSLGSALCLIVFALGVVASQPEGVDATTGHWEPGMEYFQPALHIIISEATLSFRSGLLLPQALIFGGVYFAYLAHPLQSWRLIHLASTNVQLLLSRCYNNQSEELYRERIFQACWSCFLVECDRLAEFDLPRSGIETFVDDMAFPKAGNPPDREKLCYMAEISLRRLLNRVHNSIYNSAEQVSFNATPDRSSLRMPVASLIALTTELDLQLSVWYDSVPETIKPTLGLEPTADDRERILRIRYYAARHIIHRQFVLYVVSLSENCNPSPIILERARICLESCRLYLRNTGEILKKPSQYTWTLSQSSLGAVIVLTVASRCNHLKHMVPDVAELQQLVTDNVAKWTSPKSSFETVIWILDAIRRKQQFH